MTVSGCSRGRRGWRHLGGFVTFVVSSCEVSNNPALFVISPVAATSAPVNFRGGEGRGVEGGVLVIICSSLPPEGRHLGRCRLAGSKAGLHFIPLPLPSPTFPLLDSLGTWPRVEKSGKHTMAHGASWRNAYTLACSLTFPVCKTGTVTLV